jgi:hypothetical protein
MGLFDALGKLGSAVVDTALLPVDAAVDAASGFDNDATVRRIRKLMRELEEAHEETLDDE